MTEYEEAYVTATGVPLPSHSAELNQWFDAIKRGETLPPRSVQAVKSGLVAHALSDKNVDPANFDYYHWVIDHLMGGTAALSEMSAQLIGMAFVSTGIFATDLPQPLTINPWQAPKMANWPLATQRAVIIENNGVFIWLHHLHPQWPLINQGGNDFQPAYVDLLAQLVRRGLQVTYLGDIDAAGIRMADTLRQRLPETPEFLAIQSPVRVMTWLGGVYGLSDAKRTVQQPVTDKDLQLEMNMVHMQGRFVEQEQLLDEYELLIDEWLRQA